MVYRVFVEKRPGFDHEAHATLKDIRSFLRIPQLTGLRLLNRYDVEGLDEELFRKSIPTVFSEPQADQVYDALPEGGDWVLAAEYLPGQFDQRADSASQCIQLAYGCDRPLIRTAVVYVFTGEIDDKQKAAIRNYLINPVEKREASLDTVDTLKMQYDLPETVATLTGFIDADEESLRGMLKQYGLAMDFNDLAFCQQYFRSEHRDPTMTELRVIDTYWSDHCRHTTFLTELTNVSFEDADVEAAWQRYQAARAEIGRTKPVTLMDVGTIGAKVLKARGELTDLDESEEINACTIKMEAVVDGEKQDWLLLFKNETHNHPTEIEPFGGAATCIGGAIRDPLSGRAYVYQAMRVTGAADPTRPIEKTLKGKLPQKQLVTGAAAGYSSYGNQIGLATGLVDEIYHDGYAAKRMEIGAVIGAAPAENVRREVPAPGDVVILLGGRTGRDGMGGATGSSKSHTVSSLTQCGAEVQKGNAPEERKLQRLFRNPAASKLIKRCNDFGAGGVSVAIGELADGLKINLNAVPKKYEGLDGTEIAIAESQERMAVVLAPEDVDAFRALADEENLESTAVAVVTESPRMVMEWNGRTIVDMSREFLNSNGAPKYADVRVEPQQPYARPACDASFPERIKEMAGSLDFCSRRGLAERFDSTNGACSLLMPFGGKYQKTPAQAMASLIPLPDKNAETASVMSYGFHPCLGEKGPYLGAYQAVVESIARLVAAGAGWRGAHLTFQEYFERMTGEAEKWGRPLSALLGALDAQLDLGVAAIGGKDSMSGSFEQMHVPPTLVSFAVQVCDSARVISPEFKAAGHAIGLIRPAYRPNGLPEVQSLRDTFDLVAEKIASGEIVSAWALGFGGAAEALMKMSLGNHIGAELTSGADLFAPSVGSFLVEYATADGAEKIGETVSDYTLTQNGARADMAEVEAAYEGKLNGVFKATVERDYASPRTYSFNSVEKRSAAVKIAQPRVLIPVFPGTNCEYDTLKAFERAGAKADVLVVRNLSAKDVAESAAEFARRIAQSQIIFIPGGFSGGDEPDGSGKFITAFFRNGVVSDEVARLLQARDGLIGGICNGFQALIKLGLVPYGEIREATSDAPTLTFNHIGRHQSRLVHTRVASNKSPWMMYANVGDVFTIPISHGEGRFVANEDLLAQLAENGQIATQYVNLNGEPSMDILFNPNGSVDAIEGITSPDGRVFGRMGHAERTGEMLYRNVQLPWDTGMFRGAVDYFTK